MLVINGEIELLRGLVIRSFDPEDGLLGQKLLKDLFSFTIKGLQVLIAIDVDFEVVLLDLGSFYRRAALSRLSIPDDSIKDRLQPSKVTMNLADAMASPRALQV